MTGNPAANLIGKRYQLHEPLGRGAMGAVYRATDRLTAQTVAVKRVTVMLENRPLDSSTEKFDTRLALAREFKVLASLRHPHIISVLDYGFDEAGQPFVTMELLQEARPFVLAGQGETLERKIELLVELLQALAYLHRRGILHRDLKPGNVLVTADGKVKVLDFGLAVESDQAKEIAGTIAYMAPEVLQGKQVTVASDLYAVGVMAYELIAGRHPFDVRDTNHLVHAILGNNPDLSLLYAQTFHAGMVPDLDGELGDTLHFEGNQPPTEFLDSALDRTVTYENRVVLDDTEHLVSPPVGEGDIEVDLQPAIPNERYILASIVGRLLAKSPADRYHDAYDVIQELCAAMGQEVPAESAAIRESFLQAAAFVGRNAELDQLTKALTEAMVGQGSAWLVGGESGVGKSRLLDELRTRALVEGVMLLRGQAVAEGGLPYDVWHDPLRRLALTSDVTDVEAGILQDLITDVEDLIGRKVADAVQLEGTAYQQRLLGTIASIFQRQHQPVLLLLEDLQWVSNESLEIVKRLSGMIGELPILIIGSYRIEDRPQLANELAEMKPLKLERLSAEGIAELSVSMLGETGRQPQVLELLQRETEGNVFFMVEVVRALAEEAGRLDQIGRSGLPDYIFAGGIQTVIKRRLERVPAEGQFLLQLAAVSGRELDLAVLEQVKGSLNLEDWLIVCANRAVLEVQDGIWRFAHDKLREAALNAIPAEQQPKFHRQIGEAIEKVYPDALDQAATIAQHWRVAGDVDKERFYSQRAGEHALSISAFSDAIASFERALELLPSPSSDLKIQQIESELHTKLGETLQYTGDYVNAIRRLEKGLQIARTINYQKGSARALNLMGDAYWGQGDYPKAASNCEEGLTISRAINDQRGIARALNRLGMVSAETGDYATAVKRLEESLQFVGVVDDLEGCAMVINNLGTVAYAQGDYPGARRYFAESLTIWQTVGDRRQAAISLMNLGSVAGEQGDFESATRYFQETLETCRAIGNRRGVAMALDNLGFVAELKGDYASATRYFEASLALARAIGNRRGMATTLVNLGHMARAEKGLERAADYYYQALSLAREIQAIPTLMEALIGLADVIPDHNRALTWLGLVMNHSATSEGTKKLAAPVLDKLKSTTVAQKADAAITKGASLDLETVVAEALQERANMLLQMMGRV
ncbi:MAG: tetratricopeptide repeat protein [Chloroflexi bacterium]|nr:tetratricopeptide repeat protein [Chloroflexota bacterium]